MRGSRLKAGGDALLAATTIFIAASGCSHGGNETPPPAGFGMLSGQTVLVLPVQFVSRTSGGWIGGAATAQAAARQADSEIAFALREQGGRAHWITPNEQVEALERRPSIQVDPYMLSADEARREGRRLKDIRDPLYGEIRLVAALFDTRLALWPMEVYQPRGVNGGGGRVAIRTFLLDTRSGDVLWYGEITSAGPHEPATPAALAAAAQAFAIQVSP